MKGLVCFIDSDGVFISKVNGKLESLPYYDEKEKKIKYNFATNPIKSKRWYKNGEYHREDGPAIECESGSKAWYRNGYRHREDGPAVVYKNGYKEWWINGIKLTEDEFNKKKGDNHLTKKEKIENKIIDIFCLGKDSISLIINSDELSDEDKKDIILMFIQQERGNIGIRDKLSYIVKNEKLNSEEKKKALLLLKD